MLHKVLIFNKKGELKNLITRKMLSKRHWDLFEDDSKLNLKKNKDAMGKIKKHKKHLLEMDKFGLDKL